MGGCAGVFRAGLHRVCVPTLAGLSTEVPASASPAPPVSEVAAFLDCDSDSSDLATLKTSSLLAAALAGSSASTAAATASAGDLRPEASPPRSDSDSQRDERDGERDAEGSGWRSRRAVADALARRRRTILKAMVHGRVVLAPNKRGPDTGLAKLADEGAVVLMRNP